MLWNEKWGNKMKLRQKSGGPREIVIVARADIHKCMLRIANAILYLLLLFAITLANLLKAPSGLVHSYTYNTFALRIAFTYIHAFDECASDCKPLYSSLIIHHTHTHKTNLIRFVGVRSRADAIHKKKAKIIIIQ